MFLLEHNHKSEITPMSLFSLEFQLQLYGVFSPQSFWCWNRNIPGDTLGTSTSSAMVLNMPNKYAKYPRRLKMSENGRKWKYTYR